MSMTLFDHLMVEITVSCSNQLTVFHWQYLLHSVSVPAEVDGVHDELVAQEFVVAAVVAAAAAAAVNNNEQYIT
jgi:hypothetical protein